MWGDGGRSTPSPTLTLPLQLIGGFNLRFWGPAAAFAALLGGVAQSAPLSAYGRLPAISEVALSDDGQRLAFVAEVHDNRTVVAYDLQTQRPVASARVGETKVRRVDWAGERSVIVTTSVAAPLLNYGVDLAEWNAPQILDIQTRKVTPLFKSRVGLVGGAMSRPITRVRDGRTLVYVDMPVDAGEIENGLFGVDPVTGHIVKRYEASRRVRDWVVSPDGLPIARGAFDSDTGAFQVEVVDGRAWKTIYKAEARIGRPVLIGQGRDGASLLITHKDTQGRQGLAELDPTTGAVTQLKSAPDPEQLLFHRRTQALIALGYGGDEPRYAFFNRELAGRWSAVLSQFPSSRLRLEDVDADLKQLLVHVESETDSGSYHLVDFRSETPRTIALGAAYPELKAADLSEVRRVAYKAGDGLDLDGYLTLPRGRAPKDLPLIVLVHGGPESHDDPGFDWWSQALASRGYAVLRVNFRGSDHKGQAFRDTGFGEWGGKMQTDLSDGVRHLAKAGLIDPKRVCIMGASYGGYAALAGPTLDPGVYRCAVSVSGVSDLKGMLSEEKSDGDAMGLRYWRRFMGVDKNPELAVQRSPLRLVNKVEAPILLLHGLHDSVVPFEQSERMANALKAAGKTYRFVPLDKEDHWMSREATRQQMLAEAVAFVELHNPPN